MRSEELTKLFRYYRDRPVSFVRQLLKAEPYPHQEEAMQALADGNRKVSMRSGRQVGKTTVLAWISMWYEMTRADAKTLVTAPAASQLNDAYTPEFRKWVQRLPEHYAQFWDVKAERFDLKFSHRQGFENFVTVRTARKDSPESLQGINAEGGTLVLVDEAAGVDDTLFASVSGSMASAGSLMLLTGNPNRNTGFFYDTHNDLAEQWYTLHVNSEDVPSVSRDWIEEMRTKYGIHSNEYRIHVLGEFPLAEDNTVISRELIETARERPVAMTELEDMIWALDVARFGDDESVLTKRRGNTLLPQRVWRNLDTQQLASAVESEYENTFADRRPAWIMVDSIGLGAGVVDRLRALNLPVRGINVSESPAMSEHYRLLKDELWDKARIWFERRDVCIPNDPVLTKQLAAVRKSYNGQGQMVVESKKELKRRGEVSPDRADSFVLTFAARAGKALYGGTRTRGALRRRIKGLA